MSVDDNYPLPATDFAPSRLTLARKRRGLSITQFSALVGLSSQSISNYENAKQVPAENTLERIADVLGFPPAFFLEGEIDDLAPSAVSFRARSKLTAGKRDGALAAGRLALELYSWIDQRFRLPAVDIPSLDKLKPQDAASVVRARWGMGSAPAPNMVHLLEAHGVRVFSLTPEYSGVDAFSFWRDGVPFAFLNTMKTAERGRFDAAHELGHLVLHSEEREPIGKAAETEANRFAAAFLMPREAVISRIPVGPTVDQILKGKQIWRVSAVALAHRLHELGMLSDWAYRSALIELGSRGYRTGEPGGMQRETSKLLANVLADVRAKNRSSASIASDLRLSLDEIKSMMFGLVPVAVNGGNQGGPAQTTPHLRLMNGSQ